MVVVSRKKIGMPGAHVAHSALMIRSASRDEMANLTDGKTRKVLAKPTLNEELQTKRADSPLARRDNPHDLNLKEAGSATSTDRTVLKPMMINQRCATGNGARTRPDTVPSVSGTGVPNLNKIPNGWMRTTETSHGEHILRRTLNAGRSA
jgi:hypothetical protein